MALKTILFLVAFAASCIGTLYVPLVGVIAYVMHYQIGPEEQWWAKGISHWGLRYSFALAAFTAASTWLHRGRLRYGNKLLIRHEWMLIVFVAIVWAGALVMGPLPEWDADLTDYAPLKMTKIVIFVLLMTHVVTTVKHLNLLFWAIVVGAIFLGHQADTAPEWMFATGRLNAIGGPDFRESNGLATYLVACLPIIGVQFLRTGWKGKAVCLVAGALAINGIVLTRSRGGFITLAGGCLFALLAAPKTHRKVVFAGLVVAAIGAYSLMDRGFLERTSTVTASEEERDASAQSRIEIWKGSLDMWRANPLGVGPDRFQPTIGQYAPEHPNRDAHNTFVRCYSELGIQGITLYVLLFASAASILWSVNRKARGLPQPFQQDIRWMSYAMAVALSTALFGGITITLLYQEASWWLLAMPVCLLRACTNAAADVRRLAEVGQPPLPRTATPGSGAS